MPVDPDDAVTVALDFAMHDLVRLSRQLAEPSMVWERWWSLFTAGLTTGSWSIAELDHLLLEVTRRTRSELLAAL